MLFLLSFNVTMGCDRMCENCKRVDDLDRIILRCEKFQNLRVKIEFKSKYVDTHLTFERDWHKDVLYCEILLWDETGLKSRSGEMGIFRTYFIKWIAKCNQKLWNQIKLSFKNNTASQLLNRISFTFRYIPVNDYIILFLPYNSVNYI